VRARAFPLALLLLGLVCTLSGAEPSIRIGHDRADGGVEPHLGRWIDLIVTVEPSGGPVQVEGLLVRASGEGAEFGEPVLPPPDGGGAYSRPFDVRIPFRPSAKRVEVAVEVSGRGFSTRATAEVRALPAPNEHGTLSAALRRAPAAVRVPNALLVTIDLAEGWHVYGADVKVGVPTEVQLLPAGPRRLWEGGGPVVPRGENLHGRVVVEVPFTPLAAGRVEARVAAYISPCTDEVCDPPEVLYAPVSFDVVEGGGGPPPIPRVEAAPGGGPPSRARPDSIWKLLAAAVGAGLFALLMPCTYPLVPITVSFFTKQAESGRSPVPLATAYGLGIVGIFVAIGLVVGGALVKGNALLEFANLWWVNAIFALLFLVFGLSLLGLFEIRLPGFVNDWAARATGTGGYLSVFAMGATLVVTSFTCTVPFVGALLVTAASEGIVRVTLAMGVFGLTMAAPFVALSLSPSALERLPRSGEWMHRLKVTLGILELGLVLKFVSQIDLAIGTFWIDRETFLALWSVSFLAAGLYLLGAAGWLSPARAAPVGPRQAAIGLGFLVFAGWLLLGLGGASRGALLEAFFPIVPSEARGNGAIDYGRAFRAVVHEDFEEGVRVASELRAPIFLHFTGFQ
jgi:thiol:disulfide interchange protein